MGSRLQCNCTYIRLQYCEYAPEPAKCYEWMKANLPDHYSRIEESSTYIHVVVVVVSLCVPPHMSSECPVGGSGNRRQEANKRCVVCVSVCVCV